MTSLAPDARRRISEARREAENDLKRALLPISGHDDVYPYLPAFSEFAQALFDAEAGEIVDCARSAASLDASLEDLSGRLVEGILPDHGLALARKTRDPAFSWSKVAFEHELDSDVIWERDAEGRRVPACTEVVETYAQHGDWERFAPEGVRFQIRWPVQNALVRAALRQALAMRKAYWAGRFGLARASGRRRDPGGVDTAKRAEERRALLPQGTTQQELAEGAGFDARTVRRWLKGETVALATDEAIREACNRSVEGVRGTNRTGPDSNRTVPRR